MRNNLFNCPGLSEMTVENVTNRPDSTSPRSIIREMSVTSTFPPLKMATIFFLQVGFFIQ